MRRLHVGCGPHDHKPAWWNVDVRPFDGVDETVDVSQPWPWSGLEYVYAEHFLEHLDPDQALDFLAHAGGSLVEGGVIRLSTPNLGWVLVVHRLASAGPDTGLDPTIQINRAFHGWGHRFLYTRPFLEAMLRDMGFVDIRFCGYGESERPALRGLERHGDFYVTDGEPSVLIVEASRGRAPIAAPATWRERLERDFLRHVRSGH